MRLSIIASFLVFVALSAAESEFLGDGKTPIHHLPMWRGEIEVMGYNPAYQPGTVSSDNQGRTYLRSGSIVQSPADSGGWESVDLGLSVKAAFPTWNGEFQSGGYADEHIAFDADGDAYTLFNATRSNAGRVYLLYSRDNCRTWVAYGLCVGYATIEHRDGWNDLSNPPSLLLHDGMTGLLRLALPTKRSDGRLNFGYWTISDQSNLVPNHSGAGNSSVSHGKFVHIVWPGKLPESGHDGTPQYAVTFDRTTMSLGKKALIGFGGHGKPDDHNIPAITIDKQGILHVILGAHHDQFQYRRSLEPDRIDAGWTDSEIFGEPKKDLNDGSYTYTGWMCDKSGNLHCIARWAGNGYSFRLVHLRRPASGTTWEQQRILVEPFSSGYSVYHHHPSVAPDGRIFIWYHYGKMGTNPEEVATFARKWPDRDRSKVVMLQHQAVLTSSDQGVSWHLASSADLGAKIAVGERPAQPILPAVEDATAWPGVLSEGGRLGAVVRIGSRCFVANRDRILSIDAVGSASPDASWQSEGTVEDLAVSGDLLFAAVRGRGVDVYRVNGKNLPDRVATLPMSTPRRLNVADRDVVVACDDAVRVVGQSADGKPIVRCTVKGNGKAAEAVLLEGRLYIARGVSGLEVVDISTPTSPKSLGFAFRSSGPGDKGNTAWSVAIVAGRLLTSPGPNPPYAVRVMNLADPDRPVILADVPHTKTDWGWGRRIRAWGGIALVGATQGLGAINPTANKPAVVGEWTLPRGCSDVVAVANGLMATDGAGGMCGFTGTDVVTLKSGTAWSGPRLPMSLSVGNAHLAIADWEDGLVVRSLQADGAPGLVKWRIPLAGRVHGSAFVGKMIVSALGVDGLAAHTLLPDGAVQQIGTWPCGKGARAVASSGSWVVVAEAYRTLRVFRCENDTLVPVGVVPAPGEVLSLCSAADGTLLAGVSVNAGRGAVVKLAIDASGSVREVSRIALDTDAWGISDDGRGGALAACGTDGLCRFGFPDAKNQNGTKSILTSIQPLPAVFGVVLAAPNFIISAHGEEGLAWSAR